MEALETHLEQHGDSMGPCDAGAAASSTPDARPAEDTPAEPPAQAAASESACACPRPGIWRVTNLDGYMDFNIDEQ